jgi:AcrR family transcriptional regulator
VTASRLPAAERRAAVLDCACRVFSQGSYHGTTTAEIAKEAGVTEPILYRHFESKRDLYLACFEESWSRLRGLWEQIVEDEPDPALWLASMGRAFLESASHLPVMSNLWVQALAEASEDDEIRNYLRRHMGEVHAFVVDVIRRAQAAGGIPRDRDPEAEAWLFISIGLLSMADRSLDGLVEDGWLGIINSRRQWLKARTMFWPIPGDNPETSALRPSRCLRVGVAGNLARLPHPSAWRPAGMRDGLTIAPCTEKSSGLVK